MNPHPHASSIINDELAEHFFGRRPFGEPEYQRSERNKGLKSVVETVLTMLKSAGIVKSSGSSPDHQGEQTWHATCHVDSLGHTTARVLLKSEGVSLICEAYRLEATHPVVVVPAELYWSPNVRHGWVGPRIARDRDQEWVREPAEAVVTRAILKALDAAAPDEP